MPIWHIILFAVAVSKSTATKLLANRSIRYYLTIHLKNDTMPTIIESNSSRAKIFGAKQKARPTKEPMTIVDVIFLFIVLLFLLKNAA